MSRTLLLIEDEAALRELVAEAMADMGFEVTAVANGAQGLAAMEGEARYDLIVSDVMMPGGISGIELAERAATLQPQARVLLVSGLAKVQLPRLPERVGFLQKPYRLAQLLQAFPPG